MTSLSINIIDVRCIPTIQMSYDKVVGDISKYQMLYSYFIGSHSSISVWSRLVLHQSPPSSDHQLLEYAARELDDTTRGIR